MYCRKCGKELMQGECYCHQCGHRAEMDVPKISSKESKKSRKVMSIVVSAIVIVAVIMVGMALNYYIGAPRRAVEEFKNMVYVHPDKEEYQKAVVGWDEAVVRHPQYENDFQKQLDYYYAIVAAEQAIEESDWNSVIENMVTVIEIVPDIPENYITLATAYVENWDICKAKATLDEGYAITEDTSLKNVLIWGPLSIVETAYYMLDDVPLTRGEYIFSDDGIRSYIYLYGLPLAGASYILEDGRIMYITIYDYDEALHVGLFPQQIVNTPVFGYALACYDLEYNTDGNITAATYNGETLATLEYEDGKCTCIIADANSADKDTLIYSYDSYSRISKIELKDKYTTEFVYHEDGSYDATIAQNNAKLSFAENGLWTGMNMPGDNDNWDSTSVDGHITSVRGENGETPYTKIEKGSVLSTQNYIQKGGKTVAKKEEIKITALGHVFNYW